MRRRPFSLFIAALLFLYFPIAMVWGWTNDREFEWVDVILSGVLPAVLMVGLIRVTRIGWYTLVALVALWGFRDLYDYYAQVGAAKTPLLVHLCIYLLSMAYFINPRVRHLYFDPKAKWWRTKPRYETHLPMLMNHRAEWHYPVLRNISEGGCFIETPHLLDLNETISISVPLPVPLSVSVIKAEGEVRWVSTNPLKHGMGVQFKSTPPLQAKAIREYVRAGL